MVSRLQRYTNPATWPNLFLPCREVAVVGEGVLLLALGGKGAFAADALVVDAAARAGDRGAFHLHAEVLPHEVDGRKYRQVGVALAAAGAAVEGHLLQGAGGEQVAEAPGVGGEGRVTGDYGHENARADGGAAGTHVPAGAARHLPSAAYHLREAGRGGTVVPAAKATAVASATAVATAMAAVANHCS